MSAVVVRIPGGDVTVSDRVAGMRAVSLRVRDIFGEHGLLLAPTPDQARQVARALMSAADAVDASQSVVATFPPSVA